MIIQNSGIKIQNRNLRFKAFKVLGFVLVFVFCALILPKTVYAQALDPVSWQTGATGLRTSSNPDKKTAGLTINLKTSGISFMTIQGGARDAGWGKLSTAQYIDLGEIKIPGLVPALTSETADWAHNEMSFSQGLNIWVSRLTPAILIQNTNITSPLNSLRLFSGNLNGATSNGITVVNRTAAPSFPKYVAFHTASGLQVRPLSTNNLNFSGNDTLDQNWIVVWYGNNSHFVEMKLPASAAAGSGSYPQTAGYQADAPILLKFENNPTSIKQSPEGGIDLTFSGNSGYASLMPLLGREHPKASDTESWYDPSKPNNNNLPNDPNGLDIISKINFWVTGNRLCSYPTRVTETYAYDASSDTASITDNITYLPVCSGGVNNLGFAIIPPVLSLAKDSFGQNFSLTGTLIDADYPTEFGPIYGIDNRSTYTWSITGLKKYTENQRVLNSEQPEPLAPLIQELNSEVQKIINGGHFAPWLLNNKMPRFPDSGDIYFLNPGDNLYHLSEIALALPDSILKTDLINYIKSERQSYLPETVVNLPKNGTQRTPYATDTNDLYAYDRWKNTTRQDLFLKKVPLYNLYALSRYYQLPGIEAVPTSLSSQIQTIVDQNMQEMDWATLHWFRGFGNKRWAVVDANDHLAGLIGAARLTKTLGDTQTENISRGLLAKAVVSRIAMAKYPRYLYSVNLINLPTDPMWQPKYTAGGWTGTLINYNWAGPLDDTLQVALLDQYGIFLLDHIGYWDPITSAYNLPDAYLLAYKDMVPETFRLMTDLAKQDFEIYLNKIVAYTPHWYAAFAESVFGGESNIDLPIDSFQTFLAKVFIQNENPQNLENYLSIPWLDSGDFFYMHKLAETIKAYQGWKWEDEVNNPGTPGDINNDAQVDVLDIQACVNHILGMQDLGSRADVNGDGSVDVLDVQAIVNIILGA